MIVEQGSSLIQPVVAFVAFRSCLIDRFTESFNVNSLQTFGLFLEFTDPVTGISHVIVVVIDLFCCLLYPRIRIIDTLNDRQGIIGS